MVSMDKQLKFYVDTYKNEKKFRKGKLLFCGLFTSGVHVGGVNNVFKIAKYLDVKVKVKNTDSEIYPKEVSVMYEGVEFFALGTEEEVSHET